MKNSFKILLLGSVLLGSNTTFAAAEADDGASEGSRASTPVSAGGSTNGPSSVGSGARSPVQAMYDSTLGALLGAFSPASAAPAAADRLEADEEEVSSMMPRRLEGELEAVAVEDEDDAGSEAHEDDRELEEGDEEEAGEAAAATLLVSAKAQEAADWLANRRGLAAPTAAMLIKAEELSKKGITGIRFKALLGKAFKK